MAQFVKKNMGNFPYEQGWKNPEHVQLVLEFREYMQIQGGARNIEG